MLELCGRFGIDTERAWNLTPGEFASVVRGCAARERHEALLFARIESVVLAFGGVRISPLAIIGEEDEYGDSPLLADEDDPEAALAARAARLYEERRAKLDERAEALHKAWLPPDLAAPDNEGDP